MALYMLHDQTIPSLKVVFGVTPSILVELHCLLYKLALCLN